ncbi:MAG: hypothetical protein HFG83_09975 [Dorea sp.]|jgi:hypothetical protein|nr:hypothetical protein [Dorea sp.]MCI9454140.1 hypothetical protein [Dorea sp.]
MERENLKIFEEFRSHAKPEMLEDIRLFLGVEDGVGECRVETDDSQKIYVNIVLEKFSYLLAKNIFLHLSEFMRHSYFNVYACEEMEERVCYHFITGLSGKDGVKMEVAFH